MYLNVSECNKGHRNQLSHMQRDFPHDTHIICQRKNYIILGVFKFNPFLVVIASGKNSTFFQCITNFCNIYQCFGR